MDLSLFHNIDLTNGGNIWFFSIFLIIVILILIIFITFIIETIKIVRKLTTKIFNIEVSKIKTNKKIEESPQSQYQSVDNMNNSSAAPKKKFNGGNVISSFFGGKKDSKEIQKKSITAFKEKEDKSISEHLNKLKADKDGVEKDTLESKMPSRDGKKEEEEDSHERIKIATPKKYPLISDNQHENLSKNRIIENNVKDDNRSPIGGSTEFKESNRSLVGSGAGIKIKKEEEDPSIFEGESEVSKKKLEHGFRTDSKIWQASRQTGLNLSPVERSKLVKEVFSSAYYGTNISKTDLKTSIRKLNQKMLNEKDPEEHAKIRKEIKFFKKIGGIK